MDVAGLPFSNQKLSKYEEFCEKLRHIFSHAPVIQESVKDDCSIQPSEEIAKRIRLKSISDKTDYDSYNKLTKNATHTGHQLIRVEEVCLKAWEQFSTRHENRPMQINNNVQLKKHLRHRTTSDSDNLEGSGSNSMQSLQPTLKKSTDISKLRQSVIDEVQLFHLNSHNIIITSIFSMLCRFLAFSTTIFKHIVSAILLCIILICLVVLHQPTQSYISRNTQDLIYPFMRNLRLSSLPIVSIFPRVTDLYEESCLLVNPFYSISDLDCWPCEDVRNVIDLTGFSNFSSAYYHSGIPFIVKDAYTQLYPDFGVKQLEKLYAENFDRIGKSFVETNALGITTLEDVFKAKQLFDSEDFHLKWQINRVTTSRVWRSVFPKPYFIPKGAEVSVQHFLFMDAYQSGSYSLPSTEFANVFLIQTSGVRSVVLVPTEPCQTRCRVVSAILNPKDILFYNWLFWRPVSVPAKSSSPTSLSITYIGSFY